MEDWSRLSFDPTKARDALDKALVDGKCPISGHRSWAIAPGYIELRPVTVLSNISAPIKSGIIGISGTSSTGGTYSYISTGGGLTPPGERAYPAVMATCNRCGYIALFNAVALGLVPAEESQRPGSVDEPSG